MPLDRALRTALSNFSTFFLIVALVTVPLYLVWGFMHRDVIAVQEIHADIQALPEGEQVRGVGSEAIDRARYTQFLVLAIVAVLTPVMARAARRAIETDASGRVPTALGAWRGVGRRAAGEPGGASDRQPTVGLAMVLFAVVVGALAYLIGTLVASPVRGAVAWLPVSLAPGLALALALPFALVGLIQARSGSPDPADADPPETRGGQGNPIA